MSLGNRILTLSKIRESAKLIYHLFQYDIRKFSIIDDLAESWNAKIVAGATL
jgi:hypothetical protein